MKLMNIYAINAIKIRHKSSSLNDENDHKTFSLATGNTGTIDYWRTGWFPITGVRDY